MKIKFGALVVAGSGKIGGHVASKNRAGAYLRTKVTPVNTNTASQITARALLASLSTAWGQLMDEERATWNTAVASFASTDVFGDLRNPSGINLFVKLNSNLANIGLPYMQTAPAKMEVPFSLLESVIYDGLTQEFVFAYADNSLNAVTGLVRATRKLGTGVSFVKSELRILTSTNTLGVPVGLADIYNLKYGEPATGDNIVFSVQPVTATGQKGIAQRVKVIVNAV